MIVEKTVLVFDICSSTIMMEDVQITSSLDCYANMIKDINNYLDTAGPEYGFNIYKFLGDGFILLFNSEIPPEIVYKFSEELVDVVGKIISIFIETNLQNSELPRKGITIGVDAGMLYQFNNEFIGRPINMACRLQGKLDLTESVNRIIISKKVYSKITEQKVKSKFESKPKKLKNVNNGKEVPCYESTPLVTSNSTLVRPQGKNTIQNKEYFPTAPSVIEKYIDSNNNYYFKIKRIDGKEIISSIKYIDESLLDEVISKIAQSTLIKTKMSSNKDDER